MPLLIPAVLLIPLAAVDPLPVEATPAPKLEFVSASLHLGPGKEPPPGQKPPPPLLTGVIRARGLRTAKPYFRVTFSSGSPRPSVHRLSIATWGALDPKDPTLIRFTAPYRAGASAEGGTVSVEYRYKGSRLSVQGPVAVFLLPGAPRAEQERSKDN